jgi:hypothetical protein
MPPGRLTRFLNLERPRKPGEEPPREVVTPERFSPPPSGIALDRHDDAEQPFLRCPSCEADNSKFAARCINCQTPLDTAEARAWNDRLWQERRAARELERKAQPDLVDQNRLLGESLARAVAEREKSRMSAADWSYSSTPIGMRLLGMIESSNTRFAVAMGMVAAFFISGTVAYVERNHPIVQTVAAVIAVGLLALFAPSGGRHRHRFWDDWP